MAVAVALPPFCVPGRRAWLFQHVITRSLEQSSKEALTAVDPGPREVKCLIEGHAQQLTGPESNLGVSV